MGRGEEANQGGVGMSGWMTSGSSGEQEPESPSDGNPKNSGYSPSGLRWAEPAELEIDRRFFVCVCVCVCA